MLDEMPDYGDSPSQSQHHKGQISSLGHYLQMNNIHTYWYICARYIDIYIFGKACP